VGETGFEDRVAVVSVPENVGAAERGWFPRSMICNRPRVLAIPGAQQVDIEGQRYAGHILWQRKVKMNLILAAEIA